ncbi:MAG: hypothetical protein HQ463_05660 [Bacteroidetes bacterium]|nr:hypothetical protein [Bacteroidota bacterium]
MKNLKGLFILFLFLLIAVLSIVYLIPYLQKEKNINIEDRKGGLEMVTKNYGASIDSCAAVFKISSAYLKALCMLECGGRKIFDERFEPHVYEKLKQVKFGTLSNYENVTKAILEDANDDALKNLASSWGPFQLMGYKCILLDIKIKDIRGENAVFYGTKWIEMTYGNYLKSKKYKDAFHIHNTGRLYPSIGFARTYDPDYCARGKKYMAFFGEK